MDKGLLYSQLKDSYIIMICPFDQFGRGLHKYTFTNRCKEDLDLELADGTTKIVLNASSIADDIDPKLRAFLDYVVGKPSEDEYIEKLEAAVKKAKANKLWRKEYMTLEMRDLENQEIGGQEERKKIIVQMLNKGRSAEQIADFCGIPITEIQAIQDEMLVGAMA